MAATVSVIPTDQWYGNVAVFVAKPGEVNDVELPFTGGGLLTDFGAPIVAAGEGCISVSPNSLSCNVGNYEVYLRNGDDRAFFSGQPGWAKLWGGNGDDNLVASAMGQWGEAYGEAGNDVLAVDGEGGQIADGGPGDDIVRVHTYGGHTTGIGGPGRDFIEFRHSGSTAPLPPTLDGGSGSDTIHAQPTFRGAGTVTGGPGDDTILITSIFGWPEGGSGSSYLLIGGPGDDAVTGGNSIDTVEGGPGADTIDVTDGGADTVTCGTGYDTVRYDPSDTVAADCEVLLS